MSRRLSGRDEEPCDKVVGLAAARAVMAQRPRDVLNVAHSPDGRREVAELLRAAASHRIAYREVEREELDRLSETVHHEGICLRVRARPAPRPEDLLKALSRGGVLIALDGVDNPHNIGAILRSAAFFGARGMLVGGDRAGRLTPAMVRTAEGAAEHVPVLFSEELAQDLEDLADRGADVVGADAHEGRPPAQLMLSEYRVLVLGSERGGLSPRVRQACTHFARIAGSGQVESLNVSVAAGVLLAELTRFRRSGR